MANEWRSGLQGLGCLAEVDGACAVSAHFPKSEQFGLTAQVRRAVVSVSSNIAEGHAWQGREFVHFLSVARGSLAEAESQLLLAVELGFTTDAEIRDTLDLAGEIRRMSAALARSIARVKAHP
jgi:four helix bundle protein